jgi:hypothetical protein
LLTSPALHNLESRRSEEHEPIQTREQLLVVPGERLIDITPPRTVGIFVTFECVHRLAERRSRLRARSNTPTF